MNNSISFLWQNLGIEDEVELVQQIIDAYEGEALDSGELIHLNGYKAEKYVQQTPSVCGFRKEQTIENLRLNKAILPLSTNKVIFHTLTRP